MTPRRPAAVGFVLLLAILIGFLVLRSHRSAPKDESQSAAPNMSASAQIDHSTQPNAANPANATVPPASSSAGSNPGTTGSASPQPSSGQPTLTASAYNNPASANALASSPSESATVNAIKVRRMITDYHTLTGENPVGTNAEIMAAVMGKNPRQATLGPPDGMSLNSNGELVDQWGTPYFFHQLSRDLMEIHSAGPDKIMGTADDIVVR